MKANYCCHTVAKSSVSRAAPCITLHLGTTGAKWRKSRPYCVFSADQQLKTVYSQNARQWFESLSLRHFFTLSRVTVARFPWQQWRQDETGTPLMELLP
jgi:hypothetical protein